MPLPSTVHDPDETDVRGTTGFQLMVLGAREFQLHTLPSEGVLSIGRDETCIVRLNDARCSRQHAKLYVDQNRFAIEDLQSANGTRVRDRRIAPSERTPLSLGEAVTIGAIVLLLQSAPPPLPERLVDHEEFERRLDSECQRAQTGRLALSVARLKIVPAKRMAPTPEQQAERLATRLPPGSLIALYADREYELLFSGLSQEHVQTHLTELVEVLARDGFHCTAGAAHFPQNGQTPDALRSAALPAPPARPDKASPPGLDHPTIQELYALADKAAATQANVLILGETGTGKTFLAKRMHAKSPRARARFLAINCAALPEQLIEAELFGYERGAFTGATAAKPGLLEAANDGTVFLDEVGELPLALQAKLLDVIETKRVRRVGGVTSKAINVRFIAATNRNLQSAVSEGKFREDLFYRLDVMELVVPPLRSHASSILPLAEHFVQSVCAENGRTTLPLISAAAAQVLARYSWPGNIRQLGNIIERTVLLCSGPEIQPDDLPDSVLDHGRSVPAPPHAAPGGGNVVDELHGRILTALAACHGNQSRTARELGMHRLKLNRLMKKYGIPRLRDT